MNFFSQITLVLTAFVLLSCASEKEQYLEINGKVINKETTSLLLIKPNQDMRFDSLIEIPVSDGKFHYRSRLENPEAVNLFLGNAKENGGGRYMPLFLENEKITLTIYPEEEFDKNTVEGGELNKEYNRYKKQLDQKFNSRLDPIKDSIRELIDTDKFFSDEMKEVLSEMREIENQEDKVILYQEMELLKERGFDKTPDAKKFSEKQAEISREMKEFQEKYMEQNPNLISYSFLLDELIFNKETIDLTKARKRYAALSGANPDHPYNKLALSLLTAIESIKVGKKFIDFTAPTLDGAEIKLSEQINGKVALLDLWATWCGPCIRKSREILPIYEEYRDQGFTVVGVAGEFKDTGRLERFLEKEKWPWINLVELDRQNNIWERYGINGSGGGMFLIDENGRILAKDPAPDEIRQILDVRLN